MQSDSATLEFICYDCGTKNGKFPNPASMWREGDCGACGKHKSVTEPRDFFDDPLEYRSNVKITR